MNPFKWLWRLVLLILVVFIGIGAYLLTQEGIQDYLKSQVRDFLVQDAVYLTAELVDEVSGVVVVEQVVDLQRILSDMGQEAHQALFPLSAELCLRSMHIAQELEDLTCGDVSIESLQQYQPTQRIELSIALPAVQQIRLVSEARLQFQGLPEQVIQSQLVPVSWTAVPGVRLVDRTPVAPGQEVRDQSLLMVFSRFPEVIVTWNAEPLEGSKVVDPEQLMSFQILSEDPDVPLQSWLYSLPDESGDFCLVWEQQSQCYPIIHRQVEDMPDPICGNAISEFGEECDDGNSDDLDGCTVECLVAEVQQRFSYPASRYSLRSVGEGFLMLFAMMQPYVDGVQHPAAPADLSIRMVDAQGTVLTRSSQSINGFAILQSLVEEGPVVTLEYVHVLEGQPMVYHSEQIDTSDPEALQMGNLKGAAESLVQVIETQEAVLEEDELTMSLDENIQITLPARKLSNDTLSVSGTASAASIKVCMVQLETGDIRDGQSITVSDNGSFYQRLINTELEAGKYGVILLPDAIGACEGLLDAWLALPERRPLPVIIEVLAPDLGIDVLSIDWLGTEKTFVDQLRNLAIDYSEGGRRFATRVQIESSLDDLVEVFVSLVDDGITFKHSISPQTSDELLVNVNDFEYGQHRMLVYAVFPDGQRTADVVIPFEYRPGRFAADSVLRSTALEWWQIGAIGVLFLLGGIYLMFRIILWKRRKGSMSSS